jgi:hypothetical protein
VAVGKSCDRHEGKTTMGKLLNILSHTGGGCGDCHSGTCGTCTSSTPSQEAPVKFTRRELGRVALASSVGALLTGFSAARPTKAIPQEGSPAASMLSKELNVMQKGKGPLMTVLDKFYKIGHSECGLAVSLVLC